MIKRVVITGASGMIGSALVDLLISNNIEVIAVSRPNSPKMTNISKSPLVRIIECDINKIESLPLLIKDRCDMFFNFAWQGVASSSRNDVFVQNGDVINSINAIKVAKELGCYKFVGAGSQAEYGIKNKKLGCNTEVDPVTAYGVAKFSAGKLGKIFADSIGMEFNWVRILSTYGPKDNDYTMVMGTLKKMLAKESCDFTNGQQTWDYIYSSDAATAIYAIAQKGINGKTYPIGTGKDRLLKDFIQDMNECVYNKTGAKAQLNFGVITTDKNAVTYLCADIAELSQDTDFYPRVSFKDGINKTIDFLIGQSDIYRL